MASSCRHGELSQAMRNRGIEIFMGRSTPADLGTQSAEAADLEALLAVSGVPGNALPKAMVAAHLACLQDATLHHRYSSSRNISSSQHLYMTTS